MSNTRNGASLVVGAHGFVGKHLLNYLVSCGENVIVAQRSQESLPENINAQVVSIADLLSVKEQVDTVYLLAAHIPYNDKAHYSKRMCDSNILLPFEIVKHFPKAKIVYSSSVSIYAKLPTVLTETSEIAPRSAYGISKLAGEMLVASHQNYSILRFSSVFGPGMNSPTFIPAIIKSAIKSQQITIYGDGSRLQNYLYVKDACRMLYIAAKSSENCLFNAVAEASISNLQIAENIAKILDNIEINFENVDDSCSSEYSNRLWMSRYPDFSYTSITTALRETIYAFKRK